jgi:Fic family protein
MEQILERITQKKKQLEAKKPFPIELEKNLYNWSKMALTYTSNALEGNTLTEGETALIVEKGITIGGKTVVEHLEALGQAEAIDFISELSQKKTRSQLTLEDILEIHRILLGKIDPLNSGRLRKISVRIAGSLVPRPNYLKLPQLMGEFVSGLHTACEHEAKIAADAHLQFVFIHPFVDGNGRTARLLMNLLLIELGYPLVKIDLSMRSEYINGIEKALIGQGHEEYYLVIFKAIEQALDAYLESAS